MRLGVDPTGRPTVPTPRRRIPVPALVTVLVAVAATLLVACGDDAADDTTTTGPTTTEPTTTEPTPTSEPGSGDDAPSQAVVWPEPGGPTSYADPVEAATGFATELVGFTDPIVGEFRRGDSRSGEVEVRSREDGPVTTVLVRQVDGEDWSVIGAATADIVIEAPEVETEVSSPVQLSGRATAFEGTVQTAVVDSSGERLGEGFVTGGTFGELGPFEGELAFEDPTTSTGSVLLSTVSARDGSIEEAAAVAVRFGGAG